MIEPIATAVAFVCGVGSVVCYILVLVQMFQHHQTTAAIFCIVLLFWGALIAFIYGWAKAGEWGIVKLMTIWTIFFALNVFLAVFNPTPFWTKLS
jgi:hypothetical protein